MNKMNKYKHNFCLSIKKKLMLKLIKTENKTGKSLKVRFFKKRERERERERRNGEAKRDKTISLISNYCSSANI